MNSSTFPARLVNANDIMRKSTYDTGSDSQVDVAQYAITSSHALTIKESPPVFIVPVSDNHTQNATNLKSAYWRATSMSLSTTDRATVLLPPASYNVVGSTFIMDSDYIDVIGQGMIPVVNPVSATRINSSLCPRIYGTSAGIIRVETDDCNLSNLYIEQNSANDAHDGIILNSVASNYMNSVTLSNIFVQMNVSNDYRQGVSVSVGLSNLYANLKNVHTNVSMLRDANIYGLIEDCSAFGLGSFSGNANFYGHAINCIGGHLSFCGDGTFSNATIYGVLDNCKIYAQPALRGTSGWNGFLLGMIKNCSFRNIGAITIKNETTNFSVLKGRIYEIIANNIDPLNRDLLTAIGGNRNELGEKFVCTLDSIGYLTKGTTLEIFPKIYNCDIYTYAPSSTYSLMHHGGGGQIFDCAHSRFNKEFSPSLGGNRILTGSNVIDEAVFALY